MTKRAEWLAFWLSVAFLYAVIINPYNWLHL